MKKDPSEERLIKLALTRYKIGRRVVIETGVTSRGIFKPRIGKKKIRKAAKLFYASNWKKEEL